MSLNELINWIIQVRVIRLIFGQVLLHMTSKDDNSKHLSSACYMSHTVHKTITNMYKFLFNANINITVLVVLTLLYLMLNLSSARGSMPINDHNFHLVN